MLRDRLLGTTVYFMMAPEGDGGAGGGGGGASAPAAPVGDAAPGAAGDAAAAAPAADAIASTAAGESATHESSPSLLSSAAGKGETPPQPAPAADAKSEPDAKAADSSASATDGKESAKPDDPGKASKPQDKASAETDPAAKDATAKDAPKGDQPPAPLSVEDLKLPEGVSLDAEAGKAFVDLINNAELAGKDRGQGLLDLHQKEVARVAKDISDHQRKVWDDLNAGWKDQLRKDPELGGNRLDTSLSMAKAVIEEFSSPEDAVALLKHTDLNGMGNYPPFIRLLHALGKKLNVFEDSIVSGGRAPAPTKGPGQRGWYDKSPGMNAQSR
jgi:hypothetical protein